MPLPFDRLEELPADPRPWVAGGPVGSRNAVVLGAWFMMREVEVSTVRSQLVSLELSGVPAVSIQLPATKADTAALGVTRAHACICGAGAPRVLCPLHAAWDEQLLCHHLFGPGRGQSGQLSSRTFFPTERGGVVTKQAMTETIGFAARWLKLDLVSPDRSLRISGHSLRPTGAQGLTKLGLDVWAIELLGRWGGATVRKYVRDATVSIAAARARSAAMSMNLDDLRNLSRHRAASATGQPSAEEVLELLRAHVPGYLASWRATLVEEVRDLLARAAVQPARRHPVDVESSSSSSSASVSSEGAETQSEQQLPPELFREEVSSRWKGQGKRHIVTRGPPDHDIADWVTACGWRFGRSGNSIEPNTEHPVCLKCLRAVSVA